MTKPTTFLLVLLLVPVLMAEDAPSGATSPATVICEKIIADNTKDAEKSYQTYQIALAKAQEKVLKALETTKADLNDTKKFTKLSISDRAKAIDEIASKEQEVKDGSLGNLIVTDAQTDILGVGPKVVFKTEHDVLAYISIHQEWKSAKGKLHIFDVKEMRAQGIEGGKVTYNEVIRQEGTTIWWGTCRFDFSKSDGKTILFFWPGGESDVLTLVSKDE
jgi:hypothetical protein